MECKNSHFLASSRKLGDLKQKAVTEFQDIYIETSLSSLGKLKQRKWLTHSFSLLYVVIFKDLAMPAQIIALSSPAGVAPEDAGHAVQLRASLVKQALELRDHWGKGHPGTSILLIHCGV